MNSRFGILALGCAALVLSACGEDKIAGTLQEASLANGAPDEFLVLPQKPLELPDDLSVLPQPDPLAGSRVAIDPGVEARQALGGSGASFEKSSTESALMAAVRTQPIDPNIREELRQEDDKIRNRPGGLAGILDVFRITPRSQTIYNDEKLDARAEMIRRRNEGVKTPAIDLTVVN